MYWLKYLCCVLAGGLLPCAFSPMKIWPLSIISPLILLWAWKNTSPWQAFRLGWVYGFACFTIGISWAKACYTQAGYSSLVATLAMIIFISILAVFTAAPGYIVRKFYKNYAEKALWFAFPSSWVLLEWVRSWLWTGFPWLLMGYTQIDSPLKNYAPIVGVYGISFLLLLSVSVLFSLIQDKVKWNYKKTLGLSIIAAIWLGGYALQAVNWTTLQEQEHKVSIVQANIIPRVKDRFTIEDHSRVYGPITARVAGSEFIIWPEFSIPYSLPYSQFVLDELDRIGKLSNSTFIVGAMQLVPESDQYQNTLVVLGNGSGTYIKQHLVPLWEYLPHERYLSQALDYLKVRKPQMKHGPSGQKNLQTPGTVLLPIICYEIAFAEAVRRDLFAQNANAIVNISEDGWYTGTWAIGQNLDMVRMRALENERFILKSTTTGLSAIIDNKANIIAIAESDTPQAISGVFKDTVGFTPWTRLGADNLMLIIVLLWLIASIKYPSFKRQVEFCPTQ